MSRCGTLCGGQENRNLTAARRRRVRDARLALDVTVSVDRDRAGEVREITAALLARVGRARDVRVGDQVARALRVGERVGAADDLPHALVLLGHRARRRIDRPRHAPGRGLDRHGVGAERQLLDEVVRSPGEPAPVFQPV